MASRRVKRAIIFRQDNIIILCQTHCLIWTVSSVIVFVLSNVVGHTCNFNLGWIHP